jgi:hypothetical protein
MFEPGLADRRLSTLELDNAPANHGSTGSATGEKILRDDEEGP